MTGKLIYREVSIGHASSGFGMFEASPNRGDDHFSCVRDLLGSLDGEYVSTAEMGWRNEDPELVNALLEVKGRCYNEPHYLAATRLDSGDIHVFGIAEDREPDFS